MSIWTDLLGAEVRYLDLPTYGRTRIVECGRGNAEPLVLMHGIGGHLEAYAPNVVALGHRYHVVAFDFVGHGLSNKPLDIEYAVGTWVAHLVELMDTLGFASAHLSGESLGGMVAGTFATRYPERVRRLILNTTGGIPIVSEQGHKDLKDLADLTARNVGKPPDSESVRARMQWLIYRDNWNLLTDELVGTRLHFYTRPDFQKAAPLVFGGLAKASRGEAAIEMLELEQLQCETLLLWTLHNPIHDVAAAKAALPRIKQGALYVMSKPAAHWPQFELPDEFNRVVDTYLRSGRI